MSGSEAANIGYGQHGVGNGHSAARTVVCPGVVEGTLSQWSVTVYDRHTIENVNCTFLGVGDDGNTRVSGNFVTAGFSSGPMTSGTRSIGPISGVAGLIVCVIPAFHPSNGPSFITTYAITDTH